MPKPLCFVLMPFGKKTDAAGATVDFDSVYRELIRPAIEASGLDPLRADEEMSGGIIHKPMFERLIFCDFAVADLTTANANVFYELGIRHAVRPCTTVMLFAEGGRLPFDVALLRALPYRLSADGTPDRVEDDMQALVARLEEAQRQSKAAADPKEACDSPIYQLVEDYPDIDHTKTDTFRDRVQYSNEMKQRLAAARKDGVEALRAVEQQLGDIAAQESGVIVDLFLSYRSASAWADMVSLAERMSKPLASTVMVQEQLALALNRAGRGEEAERVLRELLEKRGASSETYGILGRVYKDRWEKALKGGNNFLAKGALKKAVEEYLRGFEADWRDAYPGVNAVTLMELSEPPDPRAQTLVPVVAYAVERKIATGKPDYWDYATRLELAVLAKDEERANDAAASALAVLRESWEAETTARNLRLIREARQRRGEPTDWLGQIEEALLQVAAERQKP
jgi:tetratricopeptide (TPR) repeat protein